MQPPVIEKSVFPPEHVFDTFIKNPDCVVYLWVFYYIPWVYTSVFCATITLLFITIGLLCGLWLDNRMLLTVFFLLRIVLSVCAVLHFHVNFRLVFFSNSVKNIIVIINYLNFIL